MTATSGEITTERISCLIFATVPVSVGRLRRASGLALGGVDLTSPAGKMTTQVISAVAEFKRDLLLERTYSGIARAKSC